MEISQTVQNGNENLTGQRHLTTIHGFLSVNTQNQTTQTLTLTKQTLIFDLPLIHSSLLIHFEINSGSFFLLYFPNKILLKTFLLFTESIFLHNFYSSIWLSLLPLVFVILGRSAFATASASAPALEDPQSLSEW